MPPVPWQVRGLALLAAPALLLAEGTWVAHAGAGALLLAYLAFWLVVPRRPAVALALLTIPGALAGSLGAAQPSPLIGLLWVYVAIAVCFAVPERMSLAAVIGVTVLAMIASVPILSGDPIPDIRSFLTRVVTHATLAVGLP